jgi:hypothetical protein
VLLVLSHNDKGSTCPNWNPSFRIAKQGMGIRLSGCGLIGECDTVTSSLKIKVGLSFREDSYSSGAIELEIVCDGIFLEDHKTLLRTVPRYLRPHVTPKM